MRGLEKITRTVSLNSFRVRMILIQLTILTFLLTPSVVLGWGSTGHRVVGDIAYRLLSVEAKELWHKEMKELTPAMVSTWADHIKSNSKWKHASSWHYANHPGKTKWFPQYVQKKSHLLWAIEEQEKNYKKNPGQSLKFLVHFIGDLHQPLHLGRVKDKGGNSISLRWFKKSINLHSLWDTHLIAFQKLSYSEWSDHLLAKYKKDLSRWKSGKPIDWAKESFQGAERIYQLPKKYSFSWEYQYIYDYNDLLERRLVQGGIRLALVLEKLLKK